MSNDVGTLFAAAAAMCPWCKQGSIPVEEDGWLMHHLPKRKQTYEACSARPIHELIKVARPPVECPDTHSLNTNRNAGKNVLLI